MTVPTLGMLEDSEFRQVERWERKAGQPLEDAVYGSRTGCHVASGNAPVRCGVVVWRGPEM